MHAVRPRYVASMSKTLQVLKMCSSHGISDWSPLRTRSAATRTTRSFWYMCREWPPAKSVTACCMTRMDDGIRAFKVKLAAVSRSFDGAVKLKAICVIGGPDGTSPSKLKVYINRDDLDFSLAESLPAVQEWDLQSQQQGLLDYPTM
eukprot:359936-Chlamydomonas_euryale.AAC.8